MFLGLLLICHVILQYINTLNLLYCIAWDGTFMIGESTEKIFVLNVYYVLNHSRSQLRWSYCVSTVIVDFNYDILLYTHNPSDSHYLRADCVFTDICIFHLQLNCKLLVVNPQIGVIGEGSYGELPLWSVTVR